MDTHHVAALVFALMAALAPDRFLTGQNATSMAFQFPEFAILALADGVGAARRALRVHPVTAMGVGLVLALISGIPGIFTHGSFLTHWWLHIGSFHTGTALIFDIGVYFVVVGGILSLVLRFYEED